MNRTAQLVIACLLALSVVTARADEKDRLIEKLKLDLKNAKRKNNELEEKLYVATEGKAEDVADPQIGIGGGPPWRERDQRLPISALFPQPGTIEKGSLFARIAHIGQDQTFTHDNDAFRDYLGIESNVKIGLMLGYGLADGWDITLQRTNGRNGVQFQNGETHDYDLYDLMTKIKLLDENNSGFDASILGGLTYFWQDNDHGEVAGNAGFVAATSLGRLRISTGVLYTSISTFESTYSNQDNVVPTKRHPNEVVGTPAFQSDGHNHTTAIPVSLVFAFDRSSELFAEAAFAVDGYETKGGPSAAAGYRINTNSHSYSLFFTNTSNISYNSTFTGGYKKDRLDVFGFSISIFF